MSGDDLDRALRLLGPLEAKIMSGVWSGRISQPFMVRDVQRVLHELAYTTLMTTVNRLGEKGVLTVEQIPRQKAYLYRASGSPTDFLAASSREQVDQIVERYGEAALAAFTVRLEELTDEQRRRLRKLAEEGR